jgi:hypothetical protein
VKNNLKTSKIVNDECILHHDLPFVCISCVRACVQHDQVVLFAIVFSTSPVISRLIVFATAS